jgi:SpoVK/Ycf46/Vps4 family AAA+-type ATPase
MPIKSTLPFVKRIRFRATWDARTLSRQVLVELGQIRSSLRETPRAGSLILFSGPQGTGKTMAAAILAQELGLVLYSIDLQAVVSKYIEETEKNLAKVFAAADSADTILLFDEGDALFGKRSGVQDANDRYANRETDLLLRGIEAYGGRGIVAGNFENHMDDAFISRFRHHIHFTASEKNERRVAKPKTR